jgi:pyruvate/2-oxoglutarate dehydrogenase complex dihydrolipoamide dehydrogenase (E3) component
VVERVDVVVLGLGPGGEELAGRLAEAGLAVVGVDAELVGGECPYWGCIPSKMMIRAANLVAEGRRIDGMAGTAAVTPDWAPVARRIREEATDNWDDRVAVERLEGKGARVVKGWGRLDGPGRVVVGDDVYVADRIVLNTGARAWAPPIPGLADTGYWTNRELIEAEVLPRSLIVLGGGAIGVELGQAVARFGVAVTIVEGSDRLLALEEPEASAVVESVLGAEGVAVVTGAKITGARHQAGRFALSVEGHDDVVGDQLLVATGRRPDLAGLGVASIGLDETARAVPTDGRLRAAPGVWAIGDITGVGAFTHVSMYQAAIVAADILDRPSPEADYRALPRVTFSDPEVGSVGLTEAAARQSGLAVRTGQASIPKSARGWIHKVGNEGFIKVVEDADRKVLVGATSVGPTGGEVLSFLVLAVHAEVRIDQLRHMIYAYPTFHRAIEAALADLGG